MPLLLSNQRRDLLPGGGFLCCLVTTIGPFHLGMWWGIPMLLGEQKKKAFS